MSAELALPPRLLMGSGPTNPDPRVLRAMATGLVGQFDPAFTALMGDTQELLRQVFRTRNRSTFPVPGTSRAGMEAAVVSLVEPGERVLVVENGRFGLLFEEIARRADASGRPGGNPWTRTTSGAPSRRARRRSSSWFMPRRRPA
jgi:(S)-ureidoglycine-glyoxylate aminotransferase